MSLSSCTAAPRSRRVPLAVIALLTVLGHLLLLDAVVSAPAVRTPTEAPRTRAAVTQLVAPRLVVAQAPVARPPDAGEPVIAPPSPAPAPAVRLVVPAKRSRAQPAPLARHEAQPATAAIEPQWISAAFEAPAAAPGESSEPMAPATRPVEPLFAAAGPDEAASEAAGERPPVYPTRIPGAFRFVYRMSRGLISGRGELSLRLTAEGYEAKLEGSVAGFSILEWVSRGGFDEAGFAPLRFTDQRRGRGVQAANFRRAEHRIIYSGSKVEAPLPPGAQDRLSWMLQLAAIAQARPERLSEGERITLFVSGARGDADAWTFQVGARTRLETPAGAAQVVPLLREPRKEYDMRAQVWLDPAREYLPVQARLQSSREGGDALELVLQEVQAPP